MVIQAILFDLDETLVVETASVAAAFLVTSELAHLRYGIEPQSLVQAVRRHAGELWRAAPTITYCRAIGISSWEGLAANLDGPDPQLAALAALDVTPSAAAMVGDSIERDIAGAQAAGLHAIWLNRPGKSYHPGEHEPPAQQLTGLSRLPAALAALQGR